MRIAYFVPFLDPKPAGVGVYVEEVGRRLLGRFPGSLVFTPRVEALPGWLDPSRVRFIPAGAPQWGLAGPQRKLARAVWLSTQAQRAFRAEGIDVFFSPTPALPLRTRVPSVVVVHDLTALRVPEAYRRSTVLETRHVVPRLLRRATRVVAVSENTKHDVVRDFGLEPSRITVIGEGFDAQTFRPRDAGPLRERLGLAQPYLLYAGTLSRHKNLAVVLDALHALRDRHPSLELVIAGRTDVGLRAELERRARALDVSRRLRLVGYLSRVELAELMSGCAAFVYPSRYEGFGLAPLEAMACGAPVVASRVASLPEVVGTGGRLVEPGAPWADAIAEVLAQPRERWTERACTQASRFDWETAVDSLSQLLGAVVAK